MALLFDHTSYPSFRESAVRSSVDPTVEKPFLPSASLLYPDTAKRALMFRRRSNSHHKVVKAPAKMAHLLCFEPSPRLLPSPPVSPKLHRPIHVQVQTKSEAAPQTVQPPQVPHLPVQAPIQVSAPAQSVAQPMPPQPMTQPAVHSPMQLQARPAHIPVHAPASALASLPSPSTPPRCAVEPIKVCVSCKSSQSPCWRPSWDPEAGQLCNSCGLRYKKTGARCLNLACGKIPSKGEWSTMKKCVFQGANGEPEYSCLACNTIVELRR